MMLNRQSIALLTGENVGGDKSHWGRRSMTHSVIVAINGKSCEAVLAVLMASDWLDDLPARSQREPD
jgi:hypothetical protein